MKKMKKMRFGNNRIIPKFNTVLLNNELTPKSLNLNLMKWDFVSSDF
jgi:hypothetical protein